MIIKELDFTELNREEWINVIQSIMYWFKLEYSYFTELEKEIIEETINNTIYERNEKNMISNETLIIILFLVVNILTATCIALLDSRDYWRKKWKEDEEYILINIRGKNDK